MLAGSYRKVGTPVEVTGTVTYRTSFWSKVLPSEPNQTWLADANRIWSEAQDRRKLADYNTGSITVAAAYALRALAEYVKPRIVIEVGTFIGTSALSIAKAPSVQAVYTCDASNNCLRSDGVVQTYARVTSTQMLRHLKEPADLCFFDGALSDDDLPLLAKLTHDRTVYAFDDYCWGPKRRVKDGVEWFETVPRKGIGNVGLLQPHLSGYVLVEPAIPDTMIALMVPESML